VRGVFVKILLWFWVSLVLVGLAVHVAIIATTMPIEARLQRVTDRALVRYARAATEILDRDGPAAAAAYFARLERTMRIRAVLLGEDGREVSGRAVPPGAATLAARARESGETEVGAEGLTVFKARSVTAPGGRRYVLVEGAPTGLLRLLHDAPSAQLLRLLAVLVTAGVLCYGLARYVATPLATLRAATRQLAAGNLSVRVGPVMGRRRDEFTDLGRDFDQMAERIEALMTAERRLLRDISHELRSPLSRLNVALGLARQQAGQEQAALDRIEREADRLNSLIGQLLMLARLESGAMEPEREPVDLTRIVQEVAEDADFEARSRQRSVRITASCEAVVIGAVELLRSAVENVVRNAVRHTREHTAVEIALSPDGPDHSRCVVVSVRDHGSGVPESALVNIFHPFYRVGDARVRVTGGAGLGLTIVDRTVRLHGGTVRAANAAGGGLVVEMCLRAAPVATRPPSQRGDGLPAIDPTKVGPVGEPAAVPGGVAQVVPPPSPPGP
jgi:two-component system sensor histidine kinase CpxA